MKKVMVLGIVLTMVMGLAAVASAAVNDTAWAIQASASYGGYSLGTSTFGVKATALDAYGSEDAGFSTANAPYGTIYSSVANSAGAVQVAKNDYKAPIVEKQDKVWDLFVTGTGAGTVTVKAWMLSSAAAKIDAGTDVRVSLWNADMTQLYYKWDKTTAAATAAAPNVTFDLAYDGTPVALKMVAAVPEPSSIVAMLSGLVGLVGVGIRRRK